jgi:hypothetical protein
MLKGEGRPKKGDSAAAAAAWLLAPPPGGSLKRSVSRSVPPFAADDLLNYYFDIIYENVYLN